MEKIEKIQIKSNKIKIKNVSYIEFMSINLFSKIKLEYC